MREKLQRFMMGRYGNDKMNQVLSYVVLVMMILGIFLRVGCATGWRSSVWLICIFGCCPGIFPPVMRRIRLF